MVRFKKHLLWVIPVIIALILFCLQYISQLQSEQQLPNAGWSRTIYLPIKTKEGKEYEYTDKSGYNIYTYTNNTIYYTKLNKNLKLELQKKQVFDKNIAHIYWGNGNRYIFKKDLDVFYFDGKSTTLLAKGAGATVTDGSTVYYAKGAQLIETDVETGKTKVVHNYSFPIQTLYMGSDHNLFLTTQDLNKNWAYFHFAVLDKNKVTSYAFAKYLLGENAHISQSSAYVPHDGKFGLYFVVSIARGGISYLQYYLDMPPEKFKTQTTANLSPNPITIYQTGTGMGITDIADISFSFRNGKPTFLFVAKGFRNKRDQEAVNIYEASPNAKGKWEAERRSTTADATISPFWLGKDAIAWYSYTKKGIYQVEATSKNPALIKESLKLTNDDFSTAFSNSFLSLSRVLILILLSLIFGVGVLFVYGIISFTRVDLIENDASIVKWIMIGAFFLGELWLSYRVMSSAFSYYAPSYLVFPGNFIIIPLLVAGLSLFLAGKIVPKSWGLLSNVSIFAIYYIVTMAFLIGPYYF